MPRNERGQFTRNDISIPLPSLSGLYKILIVGILIFPWYTILKNKDYSTTLFSGILGEDYCPTCPICPPPPPPCPACPRQPPPKCPACPPLICPPCIPTGTPNPTPNPNNPTNPKPMG